LFESQNSTDGGFPSA